MRSIESPQTTRNHNKRPQTTSKPPQKSVYISYTHIFLWLIIVLPDFMEGAGKGSECIKALRMRGSVPVHRNLKCINAWSWRGKCPRTSKLSLPSCKTWRGREKGPSTERIKVHRNLKSKSAESRSG